MKLTPLLLAASLTANATLLTITWRSAPDRPTDTPLAPTDPARAVSAASSGGEARLSPAAVAAFTDSDPEALRDLLRASGLPDELIRSLVQMRLWKKYEDRFKSINPPAGRHCRQSGLVEGRASPGQRLG